MPSFRKIALGTLPLAALALGALAGPGASTSTTLRGNYDRHERMNVDGDGYRTRAGLSYTVAPGASFDGNDHGLRAAAATVTIAGGNFRDNAFDGLLAEGGARVTVTGGVFAGNGECDLYVADTGTSVTLFGAGLKFVGLPGATTLRSISLRDGTVTGTLRDNAAPSRLSFRLITGGRITLVNAPDAGPPGPGVPQAALRP